MKKMFFLPALALMALCAQAQDKLLGISTDKTIAVVFPSAILHIDRGRPEVLVQQVKEAENLLLVKAATAQLGETNLSVLTEDGNLYSFRIQYDSMPAQYIYSLATDRVRIKNSDVMEGGLSSYATMIMDNEKITSGVRQKKWGILLQLGGIYSKENALFFQFRLYNNSSIDYPIEDCRFFIRDRKHNRRTAIQEKELLPLCIWGNRRRISAGDRDSLIFALPSFTLLDNQYLAVEIGEKNGGRVLDLRIKNHQLVKAVRLPQLNGYERLSGRLR
jgi:conjugative transposon TraN protein